MDRNYCIQILKELLNQIELVSKLSIEFNNAKEKLNNLTSKSLTAVNDFDEAHKSNYIKSKIGMPPIKPDGIIKLAVPVYRSKKKIYEKAYEDYMTNYNQVEQSYYDEFNEIRERLESEEKAAIASEIKISEESFSKISALYKDAENILNDNNIVSARLKDKVIISTLLEYFEDQRVDSIKDAINLYFEEEHLKMLENYAEKQLRLTAEAAEHARIAAINARNAADNAEEALWKVDNVMRKAEEAYDLAERAYSEARDAHWNAKFNNN